MHRQPGCSGLCIALCLLLLSSCSREPFVDQLERYVTRLERVLETPAPPGTPVPAPVFPTRRQMLGTTEALSLDLVDFLRTYGCELHQVIAARNSALGRHADSGQLLAFELDFLRLAPRCIATLADVAPALAVQLQAALEHKQAERPQRVFNALVADSHYRAFWREPSSLGEYPAVTDSRSQVALRAISLTAKAIETGEQQQFDYAAFLEQTAALRSGEGGAMLASLRAATFHLRRATALLQQRQIERPLCYPGMVTPKARIFRNVVTSDFAGVIQRDLARINRQYYAIANDVAMLEGQFAAIEPTLYRNYREQRDATFVAARQAVIDHVAALKPLLSACGFLPRGEPPGGEPPGGDPPGGDPSGGIPPVSIKPGSSPKDDTVTDQ